MQENKQQIKFLGLAYAELKVNFVEGFAVSVELRHGTFLQGLHRFKFIGLMSS